MATYPYTKCCIAGTIYPSPGKLVECEICGKPDPDTIHAPHFSPPLEVELTIRRWKDGDATIDDVFKGIQEYAQNDFWRFIKAIRPSKERKN